MYFRLNDAAALRRWSRTGYAYYVKGLPLAEKLTDEEFQTLLLCDGKNEVPPSAVRDSLEKKNLIRPCAFGEEPREWSRFREYDNRYFPRMNLMITGRCNYFCRHCFNAADNAPLMSEWSFEDLCGLTDQAADCGVHAWTITGGEPMIHPRFMEILKEIHARNMFVEELNTNGYFMTREILDEMKSFGCKPLIKISFDALGFHDWMRGCPGAEERTLAAIRLCCEEGFRVCVQMQVHRKNLDALMPSARLLDSLGAESLRLIRTTEAPRWRENGGGAGLEIEEYYARMLDFCAGYIRNGLRMRLLIWQLIELDPALKEYHLSPVLCGKGEFRLSRPVCQDARKMIAVTADGEAVPCLQVSGYLKERGVSLGNLRRSSLKEILTDSAYEKNVCRTLLQLCAENEKCRGCRYFRFCTGGCRALGLFYSGERMDWAGPDESKCLFFENRWYEKAARVMAGWTDRKPMDRE